MPFFHEKYEGTKSWRYPGWSLYSSVPSTAKVAPRHVQRLFEGRHFPFPAKEKETMSYCLHTDRCVCLTRPGLTVDAVMAVVDAVYSVEAQSLLLITLDARNIFNWVKWTDMLGKLENSFQMPSYILWILRGYLRDRFLLYKALEDQSRMDTPEQ